MIKPIRRIVALAVLVILGWIVMAGMLWPIAQLFIDNRIEIATAQARLDDLRARRIDPAALEARRKALEAVSDPQAGLLAAPNEVDAASRLDTLIRNTARTHGADVLGIRAAPAITDVGVRALRATLHLRVPEDNLIRLVNALENGTPALFFESLQLRRLDNAQSAEGGLRIELTGTMRVYLENSTSGART